MTVHLQVPRRMLGLIIILLAMFVIGSLALVYLPGATVSIYPKVQTRSVERSMVLSSSASGPDFVKFVLPAKVVEKEIHKEVETVRPGEGATQDFAKGQVKLINRQDEEQPLLPKTHLRHEAGGVFFLTDTAVTIPPHGEINVNVTAKEKGASGNVPAGKFIVDKLPAGLQSEVYAESKQVFSGGMVSSNPITQSEIETAKNTLIEQAREEALGELTLLAGGARIRPELISTEVTFEAVSAEAGSAATSFTAAATVRARAFVADDNDLLSLTLLALRTSASDQEEFLEYDPDSFRITIERADFERGEARVKTQLAGMFGAKIEPSVLTVQNIAGLSAEEAREHFTEFDSVGDVQVEFWPFWVKSIPSRAGAVEIAIRQDQ